MSRRGLVGVESTAGSAPAPGSPVLWRSVPDGAVSYVYAANMVAADDAAIAVYQQSGAPIKKRTGVRAGPRGAMAPGDWDGGHADSRWTGAPNVRLHVVGTTMSVIRRWDAARRRFTSWYLNLELPWARSLVGYDSRDLILDVTVADDLSSWEYKDADQLDWLTGSGGMTPEEAEWIRGRGRAAAAWLEARGFPFDADWSRWAPDPAWPIPAMPADWAAPAATPPVRFPAPPG